jgi:hypothetical protein
MIVTSDDEEIFILSSSMSIKKREDLSENDCPRSSSISSSGFTDVETSSSSINDSRRSSRESNFATEGDNFEEVTDDGVNSHWYREIPVSLSSDFDISSCESLSEAKRRLLKLQKNIGECREKYLVVRVGSKLAYDLATYVNRNWVRGCECSHDQLIFKASQSGVKSEIHYYLQQALRNQNLGGGKVLEDVILNIGDGQRAPDVGFWYVAPTIPQLTHPLAQNCPPPNIWIEVFFNNPQDRGKALLKIRDYVLPHCGGTCAVLAIGLPNEITPVMRNRIGKYLPELNPTTAAPVVEEGMPRMGPYVGYWPLNTAFEEARWFRILKNHHIMVTTVDFTFRFEFNDIINGL